MSAQGGKRSDPARGGSLRGILPEAARAAAREAAYLRLLGLLFERPRPAWVEEVQSLMAVESDERLRAVAAQPAQEDRPEPPEPLAPEWRP